MVDDDAGALHDDLSKKFDSLAMLLPTNCYSTVCKLRKKPNFSDVDDAIGDKLLLECDNASIINKQLLSYLYKKCFNDLHVLYDILEQLVAADKLVQLLKYKTDDLLVAEDQPEEGSDKIAGEHYLKEDIRPAKTPGIKISDIMAGTRIKMSLLLEDLSVSSSDKVVIATTVDALSEQNIISYNEVVDLCIANGQAKKKMLDDKLDTLSSAKTKEKIYYRHLKPWVLRSFSCERHKGIIDKHYVGLCQSLQGDVDHLLATLLQLQALSDKEMETVYSSDNKIQAIIDGLITNCALKNDLLLFCGVFECLFGYKGKIDVIEMLRDDLSQAVDPDSEAVHATSHASPVVSVPTESSTPLSLQPGTHKKSPKHPSAMRSGEVVTLSQTSQDDTSKIFHSLFSHIPPDLNSEVTTLLKKNYGRLCKCLPEDYSKTLEKLKVIMSMPDHICQQMHNHKDTNQLIIYVLLSKVNSIPTIVRFFSILESLVDDGASKQIVLTLKQECLGAVHSSTTNATVPTASAMLSTGLGHLSINHDTSIDSLDATSLTPVDTTQGLTLTDDSNQIYLRLFSPDLNSEDELQSHDIDETQL